MTGKPTEATRRKATEWLVRLQSPELTGQQRAEFLAWLSASEAHQRAYVEAEALWDRLGVVEGQQTVQPADTPVRRWLTAVSNRWWGLGTAVAATIAAVVVLLMPPASPEHFETAVGERRELVLADGSRVALNTDSRMLVDRDTSRRRLIKLESGEAYFEVTPDPAHPFLVETAAGTVRVLGTRFAVRVDHNDMQVTVMEGKVGLALDTPLTQVSRRDFTPPTQLVANQQLSASAARSGGQPHRVDAGSVCAWREGKLVYTGEPLSEVVADISRYFEGELIVSDPKLKNLRVVAALDLEDRDTMIEALETAFNIEADTTGDNIFFHPKPRAAVTH